MSKFKTTLQCLVITSLSLSSQGCLVMLSQGGANFAHNDSSNVQKAQSKKPQVYAMRGLLGIFSTGMDSLAKEINQNTNVEATSMSYLESKKLVQYLKKRYHKQHIHTPIVLIGHSFGADKQIVVARELKKLNLPVDTIITLDNTKSYKIPSNVRVVYNIMSDSNRVSKALLGWGSRYTPEDAHTKIYNLNVKNDLHITHIDHFNIDKSKKVHDYILSIVKQLV